MAKFDKFGTAVMEPKEYHLVLRVPGVSVSTGWITDYVVEKVSDYARFVKSRRGYVAEVQS